MARIAGSASGSFSIKSEWASTTISLQPLNTVPPSRVVLAIRESKTSNAFLHDTYVALGVSSLGLTVIEGHAPQVVDLGESIPP